MHFAELFFSSAGKRQFNVLINGNQVLTSLDIFATVGANKALVRDFDTVASSAGEIVVQYVNVVENAKSSGIEILSGSGGSAPAPGNQPPTVATAASANANPTTGTQTALSVLGADDAPESGLTYVWSTSGTPPGTVAFSNNGSNGAKSSTATFGSAGSYALVVKITDANGATTSSSVNVVVNQKLTGINITPATAQVAPGATQQFTAGCTRSVRQVDGQPNLRLDDLRRWHHRHGRFVYCRNAERRTIYDHRFC